MVWELCGPTVWMRGGSGTVWKGNKISTGRCKARGPSGVTAPSAGCPVWAACLSAPGTPGQPCGTLVQARLAVKFWEISWCCLDLLAFPGGQKRQEGHLFVPVWALGAWLCLPNTRIRLGNSANKTKAPGQLPRVFKGTEAGDVHVDTAHVKRDRGRARQPEASVARPDPAAPSQAQHRSKHLRTLASVFQKMAPIMPIKEQVRGGGRLSSPRSPLTFWPWALFC